MAALRYRAMNPFRLLKHRPWPKTSAIAPRLNNDQPAEEELTPYYDPSCYYPAQLGDVLNERYQLATKLGHGSSSTVWLARDVNRMKDGILSDTCWTHLHWNIAPRLKIILQMVLHALDYLHSECRVIHTDLKPDNIMVMLEDESILSDSARDEYYHPLPQKICEDRRTIYLSRNNYGIPRKPIGVIRVTGFGYAVCGDQSNSGCIQAEIYRAPEVIVDAGYSYSADIWSLGVMLWDLLEGNALFPFGDATREDETNHLAHIAALLGPPPQDLIGCGRRSSNFYESDASLKIPDIVPTDFNFDTVINKIHGEDKRMFIEFVKRMIKWRPEERSTAKELLSDPWLYADFL